MVWMKIENVERKREKESLKKGANREQFSLGGPSNGNMENWKEWT